MSTITLYKATAPGTPASGTIIVYSKTDGRLYYKSDAGVEYQFLDSVGTGLSAIKRIITGATDTILASDNGKVLIYTAAGGCAVDYPDGLDEDFQCSIIGAGAVVPVITPDTDTINGVGTGFSPAAQFKALYLIKYGATTALAVY